MANGNVKWFSVTKDFGFIAADGGAKNVFAHISSLQRVGLTTLNEDQKVTFETNPAVMVVKALPTWFWHNDQSASGHKPRELAGTLETMCSFFTAGTT
mgnify:FL=1